MLIPTTRIEAFSDGVIAIIITIMVFELKFRNIPTNENLLPELAILLPKFLSYAVSFVMLAIMWVNHHQIFHQLKTTDRRLPWINIHLLFWMSLIPFGTNLVGENYKLNLTASIYGFIFFMCASSFTLMRGYISRKSLIHDNIETTSHQKIQGKNKIAMSLYFISAVSGFFSVYATYLLIIIVPLMYFLPEKINYLELNK